MTSEGTGVSCAVGHGKTSVFPHCAIFHEKMQRNHTRWASAVSHAALDIFKSVE